MRRKAQKTSLHSFVSTCHDGMKIWIKRRKNCNPITFKDETVRD